MKCVLNVAQDRARQLLATDELAGCLAQVSSPSQRVNDVVARKKTTAQNDSTKALNSGDPREVFTDSEDSQERDCNIRGSIPEAVEQPPALSNSEHAYSSFSKGGHHNIYCNYSNYRMVFLEWYSGCRLRRHI